MTDEQIRIEAERRFPIYEDSDFETVFVNRIKMTDFIEGAGFAYDKSQTLFTALEQAVSVIKSWHKADDVWDIYYNHAPEMKLIREAINEFKK